MVTLIIIIILYELLSTKDMGFITELKGLPLYVISIIITIGLLIPFWVLVICFYYPNVITFELYHILLLVAVPSLIYYFTSWIYIYLFYMMMDDADDKNLKWIGSSFTLVIELAIFMLIAYFFISSIKMFFAILFGLQAYRILFFGFLVYMKNKPKIR